MGYVECVIESCGNPVFSKGLCRKHYEQERLATAAPCSVLNCDKKTYRGLLCATHYREHIKNTHPTCTVNGCTSKQKNLTLGLCQKHLFRFSRHGSVEQPRNSDWGAREKHPLYQTYHWHKRKASFMCKEWEDDFWTFVNDVRERPDGHTLRKIDSQLVLGPGNWDWVESIPSANKASYQKEWRKRNPEKSKNSDLKKMYGITLEQYTTMAKEQNYTCAICGEKDTDLDKFGVPRHMPVDHCHVTNKVRALLCGPCNRSLGGFKDSPELLRKAAAYIEKYK